jgi:hypothetical protein
VELECTPVLRRDPYSAFTEIHVSSWFPVENTYSHSHV